MIDYGEYPCEVCGAPSVWRSGPDDAKELVLAGPQRMWFLCDKHAEAWSNWEPRQRVFKKWHRMPDGEKSDEVRQFIFMLFKRDTKGELKRCPFCGHLLEEGSTVEGYVYD